MSHLFQQSCFFEDVDPGGPHRHITTCHQQLKRWMTRWDQYPLCLVSFNPTFVDAISVDGSVIMRIGALCTDQQRLALTYRNLHCRIGVAQPIHFIPRDEGQK